MKYIKSTSMTCAGHQSVPAGQQSVPAGHQSVPGEGQRQSRAAVSCWASGLCCVCVFWTNHWHRTLHFRLCSHDHLQQETPHHSHSQGRGVRSGSHLLVALRTRFSSHFDFLCFISRHSPFPAAPRRLFYTSWKLCLRLMDGAPRLVPTSPARQDAHTGGHTQRRRVLTANL